MTSERTEVVWLETRTVYTADEVVRLSGLPQPILEDLISCGVLPAADEDAPTGLMFENECVVLARAAGRLREHFELDERGLAVAVSLLRRVRRLEARMAALDATRSSGG